MTALGIERRAKQRITLGLVRTLVLAPVVFALPIPLVALFHSFVPLYVGVLAGVVMAGSGGLETTRGVLELRAVRRAQRLAVPEARLIDRR